MRVLDGPGRDRLAQGAHPVLQPRLDVAKLVEVVGEVAAHRVAHVQRARHVLDRGERAPGAVDGVLGVARHREREPDVVPRTALRDEVLLGLRELQRADLVADGPDDVGRVPGKQSARAGGAAFEDAIVGEDRLREQGPRDGKRVAAAGAAEEAPAEAQDRLRDFAPARLRQALPEPRDQGGRRGREVAAVELLDPGLQKMKPFEESAFREDFGNRGHDGIDAC